MKIYWIILNGEPRGPFTPQEIASMGVVSAELRVWHKGLPEWVALSTVPELAALLPEGAATATDSADADAVDVEAVEIDPAEPSTQQEPSPQQAAPGPQAWFNPAPAQAAASSPRPDMRGVRMPATYLPWNILATICCCLPAGIAGIIFSARVSKKFYEGDMAAARRASESAAWCLMLSIVLGLVCWPFQMLFSGL